MAAVAVCVRSVPRKILIAKSVKLSARQRRLSARMKSISKSSSNVRVTSKCRFWAIRMAMQFIFMSAIARSSAAIRKLLSARLHLTSMMRSVRNWPAMV
ncbi:hypothetical protein D9M72_597250 [compost metagenome]